MDLGKTTEHPVVSYSTCDATGFPSYSDAP